MLLYYSLKCRKTTESKNRKLQGQKWKNNVFIKPCSMQQYKIKIYQTARS